MMDGTAANPLAEMERELEDQVDSLLQTPVEEVEEAPVELDAKQRANFVLDVARKIYPRNEIAARYMMSAKQFIAYVARPDVNREIRAEMQIWNAEGSTVERVRQYAATGAEQTTHDIVNLIRDPSVSPPTKIEAYKTLAKLGGVEPVTAGGVQGGGGGSGFSVTINLGGQQVERITVTPTPPALEGEATTVGTA